MLSAIEKHTTGAAEMSDLDCVVYLADTIEPGRRFLERSRTLVFRLASLFTIDAFAGGCVVTVFMV